MNEQRTLTPCFVGLYKFTPITRYNKVVAKGLSDKEIFKRKKNLLIVMVHSTRVTYTILERLSQREIKENDLKTLYLP